MKRRLVILTEIISPYRIPLFNTVAQHAAVDLHVMFLAETDPSCANGGYTRKRSGSRTRYFHRGESGLVSTMHC